MKCCLAVIVISLQIIKSNGTVNYCGSRLCGHSNGHTFCRYQPGPGLLCTGYVQVPLSMEDKARVIARLNRRRSELAMGLDDWPPAADMLKLRWVEELSREAQLWADQCRPPGNVEEYDVCRNLYSTTVGQCVASIVGEAPGLRPETMVDIWYMQRILYDGNFTSYVPSTSPSQNYGDFAQMVWSHTYMVGCGRSRFMVPWRGRLRSVERLVCNFAPRGPSFSRPLWTPGPPASMCPPRSRPDMHLPGLCTFQNGRNISDDRTNSTTPEEHLLLDTVLEIENNQENYIGILDEIYLKKFAISNFSPMTTEQQFNFIHKREIIEILELDEVFNVTTVQPVAKATKSITHDSSITKKKVNVIGRPKPYNLEDLNDINVSENIIRNEIVEETTQGKDIYADLEYADDTSMKEYGSGLNYTTATDTFKTISSSKITIDNTNPNMSTSIMLSNINETTKVDELEDYLSDPETFRQLQEALERMENNLAGSVSTVAKVRRELRTLPPNITIANRRRKNDITVEEIQAEIERNRTKERGPMLNMVLKYLPYLKPYEKTIMGEDTANSVTRIMPNVILVLVMCM